MQRPELEAKMREFLSAAALCSLLALAGCSQPAQEKGPDYADDEAMAIIADGLEARSDVITEQEKNGDVGTTTSYKEAVQTELDTVSSLKDRQYEDSKLQELIVSYINTLNDSMNVLSSYTSNSLEFYNAWNDVYNERTSIISTFVDEYGLTLDAQHQDVLEELAAIGTAAIQQSEVDGAVEALVQGMVFEKTSDGYGWFTYVSTAQNTTGYNLGNVSLVLSLYDAEGVKAEETYASTNSWTAGETVRFEAMGETDAAEIKVAIQYYDLAD